MGANGTREDAVRARRLLTQRLTTALKQRPGDVDLQNRLGTAYEELSDLTAGGGGREKSPYLRKAMAIYLAAADTAKLSIHRAAFYRAASSIYGRMRDYKNQYRLAKKAVAAAPFSAPVWVELRNACLRTGRYQESREAAKKAADWTLPSVRAQ